MQADYECLEKEVKQTLWAVWDYARGVGETDILHSVWIDKTNAEMACEQLNRNRASTPFEVSPLDVMELSWREFIR